MDEALLDPTLREHLAVPIETRLDSHVETNQGGNQTQVANNQYIVKSWKASITQVKTWMLVRAEILKKGDELHYSCSINEQDVKAVATIMGFEKKTRYCDRCLNVNVFFMLAPLTSQAPALPSYSVQYSFLASGPSALQASILEHHGFDTRRGAPRFTWRLFDCYRRGHWLGSLEDLRRNFYQQQTADPTVLENVAAWTAARSSRLGALNRSRDALAAIKSTGDLAAYTAAREQREKTLRRTRRAITPLQEAEDPASHANTSRKRARLLHQAPNGSTPIRRVGKSLETKQKGEDEGPESRGSSCQESFIGP